ncbi:MAG: thioredoxin 1 [Candidatus Westeberhardia cardiocondylae]|nr:thioredoxin 1 [Candidatus Westeberhardia cardiocondylae]
MENYIIQIDDNNFQKIFKKKGFFLIDFWATWCNPCKIMQKILFNIAKEFKKRLVIAKLNVDENPKIVSEYNVRSVPTLLLFNNGEIIDKHVGSLSHEKCKMFIQKHIDCK